MAITTPSLPLPPTPASPPNFWTRESPSLKQGIKTGLAGAITYAMYVGWHLPQGYWAVFTALVVAQVTQGASWKPALYRTIGSTSGALAAMLLFLIFGPGTARIGIVLFILATLFGFLTVLHPSFSAAGFTAAIVLLVGRIESTPFQTGWLRVLYTLLGSFVAFAVGGLLWPVRAREGLRRKIANILDGAGALYRAVTAAALHGAVNDEQVRELDRQLHDLRRGITQQMEEARSELAFSRFDLPRFTSSDFNESAYKAVVDQADQIRRRLTAMAEDSNLYAHAQNLAELIPSLPSLAEKTAHSFSMVAEAVRTGTKNSDPAELVAALHNLDADLAKLREQRITSPFALDRMLPFWSFVFNLREVAQDVRQLESLLPLG
jgi:uncharacterized membrane protein YccC